MKIKTFIAAVLAMIVSISVYAKDQEVTMDGKHILVTDVSESGWGNSQIHSSDLSGGVYIIAGEGYGNLQERWPNAEKAIAEVFAARGYKVVNKLEDASMAIAFGSLGSLEMAKADQAAAYSAAPNAGQVIGGGIQLAGAVINSVHTAAGGTGGAVGFIAGAIFNSDSKAVLQVMTFKNPTTRTWRGASFATGKDGDKVANAKVFYKLEKGKEASDDTVLKMAVDQWIQHYVIIDGPSPTQAVATPATTPVAQAGEVPAPAAVPVSTVSLDQAIEQKK